MILSVTIDSISRLGKMPTFKGNFKNFIGGFITNKNEPKH